VSKFSVDVGGAWSGKASGMIVRCLIVLSVVSSLTACGGEKHVDPAAIAEVRSVGHVLAEATSEWYWGDQGPRVTSFNKTFIVDMTSRSSAFALDRARALLVERGWKVDFSTKDGALYLRSEKWADLQLHIYALTDYVRTWGLEDSDEPEISEAIRRAQKRSASEALLIMQLYA
jgi:hypothetical protein